MKNKFLLALAISTVAYSQSSFAGSITDTYTTGDTLTADKLNNIKSAVNDNDTRVTANIATFDTVFSGDGSAGNLTLAAGESVNWISNPPDNPYFGDILLNTGSTLIVPAGTTIYCNGSFVNAGTLIVQPATAIGSSNISNAFTAGDSPTNAFPAYAHPGDTPAPASMGEINDITVQPASINLQGGGGGLAIQKAVATTAFGKFKFGGGSGAGFTRGAGVGGRAGGLVKIYARINILNSNGGQIVARGEDGDDVLGPVGSVGGIGGGGGGIVVLAARFGGVQNVGGTIDVSGGNGSTSTTYAGNGGGGGGGIVIMASPVAPLLGTETIAGGSGGTGTLILSTNTQIAGGGGGGSGGKGGTGGYIQSNGAPVSAGNGDPGYVINLTLDPIALAR